ncbi:hypothetical protein [Cetobacterium sp.]|uniref:hypothetical protein n=1 Tax=Cetobacterium sp. TaxID=2071632 RepID=UPI002FC9C906
MARNKKMFVISDENLGYLKQVKESKNLKYDSEALELIIREHKENSDLTRDAVIEIISENIANKIDIKLSKILKASNHSDKNSQILIELLNGMFFKNEYKAIVTTSEDKCMGLIMAEKEVNDRITKNRVRTLDEQW